MEINELAKTFKKGEIIYEIWVTEEYELLSQKYFNSIKDTAPKTIYKRNILDYFEVIVALSLVPILFGILTLVPLLKKIIPLEDYILVLMLLGIYVVLIVNIDKFFRSIRNLVLKNDLSDESLNFYHLQVAIDNLKFYSTNNITSHLNKAVKNFKKYLASEVDYIKLTSSTKAVPIDEILEELSEEVTWFHANESTLMISSAFEKSRNNLPSYIRTGKDIDAIIEILSYLKATSYSKLENLNNEEVAFLGTTEKVTVKKYGELFLYMFSQKMFSFKIVQDESEQRHFFTSFKNSLNRAVISANKYLHHPNFLVSMIGWSITLSVLATIPYFILVVLEKPTETYISGAYNTIGMGAITVALGLRMQKNSNTN